MISDVLKDSVATEPTPFSTFKESMRTILWVIFFLVLITEILFTLGFQICTILVPINLLSSLIEAFDADSINTSPKTLNPAGWVVDLIKDLQLSIEVFDLTKYE